MDTGSPMPSRVDDLVGRDDELRQVSQLAAPVTGATRGRVVTIHGVGGGGKTRLAQEVVHQAEADGRDVGRVRLRQLRDPQMLIQHIASELQLQDMGDRQPGKALIATLRQRNMLILLDNCEHLRGAVRRFVAALLAAAPGVTVLATSREPLRIRSEVVFALGPLHVPRTADFRPDDRFAAAELFISRAEQARPGVNFRRHYRAIVDLCRRVDGLPLAIELLASNVLSFSIAEIAERLPVILSTPFDNSAKADALDWGLDELDLDPEDDVARADAAFTSMLDWSWQLCSCAEQLLWRRLALFPDSWDLTIARAVCADDDLPADVIDATHASLVQKSVIVRVDEVNGTTRWRMLETIRNYGEHQLTIEADEVRWRHYCWITETFEHAARSWLGPQEIDVLRHCRRLLPDVWLALDFCTERGEAAKALRLLDAVFGTRIPFPGGVVNETSYWFNRVAELTEPGMMRANALAAASYVDLCKGSPTDARFDEIRALEAATGEKSLMATVAEAVYSTFGKPSKDSIPVMEQASKDAYNADPENPAWANLAMWGAFSAVFNGDRDTAERVSAKFLADSERIGAQHQLGWARWTRAMFCIVHCSDEPDRLAEAERLFASSIPIHASFNDRWGPTWWALAESARSAAAGEHERAARLGGIVAGMTETTGTRCDKLVGFQDALSRGQNQARAGLGQQRYMELFNEAREEALHYDDALAVLVQLAAETDGERGDEPLSVRELEVAHLVTQQYSDHEIAKKLFIAKSTVRVHLRNIYRKSGRNRETLATWLEQAH
ncbi:LuxR C-terminal-related transcriptional regulator [Saccharopolyspora elongata]|uniref:HTH luxR-type domain-containing protein n=1 Tax=Saccharopolyspora elongata TaxID=2530387 RepID=A0A4R4Y4E6_9PSEU|nr:LuxR C-terminal-related transcriptional regulator [Saccharopolyspora elongata]TDD37772.1 hypothetical protein E1288_39890 [Saccharopolyspora elongata]